MKKKIPGSVRIETKNKWKQHGDPLEYQEIRGKECTVTLERRPHYCDRGNYIAKLFPFGKLVLSIDHADMWPRYYFDEARAKAEIEAWLEKRGQAL